jgi:hypothetical protein
VGRLTAGAAAGYSHVTTSVTFTPGSTASSWELVLAPRVGYAAPLGRRVSLWPRLGLTYVHGVLEDLGLPGVVGYNPIGTVYALTIEVPVVVIVTSHVFVDLGPTSDQGLGGRATTITFPVLYPKQRDIGVQAALGGYF